MTEGWACCQSRTASQAFSVHLCERQVVLMLRWEKEEDPSLLDRNSYCVLQELCWHRLRWAWQLVHYTVTAAQITCVRESDRHWGCSKIQLQRKHIYTSLTLWCCTQSTNQLPLEVSSMYLMMKKYFGMFSQSEETGRNSERSTCVRHCNDLATRFRGSQLL